METGDTKEKPNEAMICDAIVWFRGDQEGYEVVKVL